MMANIHHGKANTAHLTWHYVGSNITMQSPLQGNAPHVILIS